MFLKKNTTTRLLALSFMLNFAVVQPVCSTITYAATRDSDYHTIENTTSKKIQSSREFLYKPYKSNAERQAEAEALRQQQAEEEARRKAEQEAQAQAQQAQAQAATVAGGPAVSMPSADYDANMAEAKERLQQMMKDHPHKSNFNNAEERQTETLSARIANQLSDKDKEVLLNTYRSVDEQDEKYRVMAGEVCKAAGLSETECLKRNKMLSIQNCLWGELSHVEASGEEYENAKKTAMDTCLYVLQSEENSEVPDGGILAGLKNFYDSWNEQYKENAPDALKLVLGDSLAEVGVTAGLTVLSLASFGISAGALATLRTAKAGAKIASKADKLAGLVGKSPNLTGKFTSTLSNDTRAALELADDAVFKKMSARELEAAQTLRINGYGVKNASSTKELAEEAFGAGSSKAKLFEKAIETVARDEKKIHFNALERTRSNYAKVAAVDLAAGKAVNAAGAGEHLDHNIESSSYDVAKVDKALHNEEFAKLLESKRDNAEITRIAKAVSTSAHNSSVATQISDQVEANLGGVDVHETPQEHRQAFSAAHKRDATSFTSGSIDTFIKKHPQKISAGLRSLGITPEDVDKYQD